MGSRDRAERSHSDLGERTFVITGRLAGRGQAGVETLIAQAGGTVVKAVSAATTYLVVGRDPGPELSQALRLGVRLLTEQGLVRLLANGVDTENVPKRTLHFREVAQPITDPITKFGGQPVWLDEPQWPISRATSRPMMFICQVRLTDIPSAAPPGGNGLRVHDRRLGRAGPWNAPDG